MATPIQPQSIEVERLDLQAQLDGAKTAVERNELGQFATPTALARDILGYARNHFLPGRRVTFLDPAIGTGSFYSALTEEFPSESIDCAIGYEIDPHYGEPAKQLWADSPLDIRIDDFTRAEPSVGDRATLLICNPPYVRHHHIAIDDKRFLSSATLKASGMRLSGLAGLYCHFLGLAHSWMAEDALAGWLIPSEFMDVNYGTEIKRYLLESVTLSHIHRFDPSDAQFDDALVSSTVVWFSNTPPIGDQDVTFSYGGSLVRPRVSASVRRSQLACIPKWSRLPSSSVSDANGHQGSRLGDYFHIRRGLASGSNEFFVVTSQQIDEFQLPSEFLRPILPSPRYLQMNEVAADPQGRPLIDRQLYLIDCLLPEGEVEERFPTLWQYFQRGIKLGVNDAYLSRHRSPWYAQEQRPPAPIVCTYMGRIGTRAGRPFRFILNHSCATAANVYLMLYPKPPLAAALGANSSLLRNIWQELNSQDEQRLLREARVYGGGLHKLEPRELANVQLDSLTDLVSVESAEWRQSALV